MMETMRFTYLSRVCCYSNESLTAFDWEKDAGSLPPINPQSAATHTRDEIPSPVPASVLFPPISNRFRWRVCIPRIPFATYTLRPGASFGGGSRVCDGTADIIL